MQAGQLGAGRWAAATTYWFSRSTRPIGMKYMFAMLCSNPAATNAEIGNMIAADLVHDRTTAGRQPDGQADEGVREELRRVRRPP